MALPGSGQISLGDIAGELGVSLSNVSLRSMSSTAGFSTPDSVGEFYGYNQSPALSNLYVTENNASNTSYLKSASSDGWIKNLTQATSFSVSFWVYPKTVITTPNYAFHIRDFNSTSFFYNNIAIRWSSSLGMSFFMSSYSPNTARTLRVSNLFANEWSHYVITYNGTNGLVRAYRNGTLSASSTFSGLNMLTSTNRNLAVGGLAGSSSSSNTTQAKIDELAFYDRVLSDSEITSIYASRQVFDHASLSGLYDWWRFENNGDSYTGALNLTNYNSQLFSSITMPF